MSDLTVTGTGASPPSAISAYTCQTDLEAVNLMLATIGEQPVAALGGTFNEALIAEGMLFEISREVQTRGWSFNEEYEYPLVVLAGVIALPENTLKVVVTGETDFIVRRGTRLYNRTKHTDVFTADVEATMTFFLPYTDLPQVMRTYIALRAARKFQMKVLGAESLGKFTELDENQAWIAVQAEETDTYGFSMKNQELNMNRG